MMMSKSTCVLDDVQKRAYFWAFAATFGAAWGIMEITVGSFLHMLRLPFSGLFLAWMGAVLLIAERQLLNVRGISVATGLIAAITKSISPGGIILGPMLGIITEAFLAELCLSIIPALYLGAISANAICLVWPLLQKILTQYVMYGSSVLDLYLSFLRRLARTTWWLDYGLWMLLLSIVFLLSASIFGAHLGLKLGRASLAQLKNSMRKKEVCSAV